MKTRTPIRALSLALCLLFFVSALPLFASADSNVAAPPAADAASAVYFYHIEGDNAIVTKNETTLLPAGSTVKLLSGLILCEEFSDRRGDTVVLTNEMLGGSNSGPLTVGRTVTIGEILYAAVCGSYNNAYQALVYLLTDGNSDAFLVKMNARAKELGATHSSFYDPIGTMDKSYTTAFELAQIAKAAYQNELYMQLCGTEYSYLPSLATTIYNRNELVHANKTNKHHLDKCNGMTAGTTTAGGDCVVASATNGRESYLCIVLGCKESGQDVNNNQAYLLSNKLINWVYRTYADVAVVTPETVVCKIPVTVSDMTTEVEVRTSETLTCYLPATVKIGEDVTYSIRLTQTELEAPVTEGIFVGYLAILYQNEIIGTVPLYTAGSAERSSFVSSLKVIQSLTKDRRFVAGAIFFSLALLSWVTVESVLKKQRHRRWDKYFSNKINTTKR